MTKKAELPNLVEFKRGMLGILKVLAQESLEAQRLDYYTLYKTMLEIVETYTIPEKIHPKLLEDEEKAARMILNFPSTNINDH